MGSPTAATRGSDTIGHAELEEELRQADEDFANGDFVDVTIDELDRCIAAGEWPWQRERSG